MTFWLKLALLATTVLSTFVVMCGIDSIVEQNLLTEFLLGLSVLWLACIISFTQKDCDQLNKFIDNLWK
jgi:hypothetical protein